MKRLGLILLLTACGPDMSPGECGVLVAGDYFDRLGPTWLTYTYLNQAVRAALQGGTRMGEQRMQNVGLMCETLRGYRVYTQQEERIQLAGRTVGGWAECWFKMLVVGTPADRGEFPWQAGALVHELTHGMQGCAPPMPTDDGRDKDHANWDRAGISASINQSNSEPPP